MTPGKAPGKERIEIPQQFDAISKKMILL